MAEQNQNFPNQAANKEKAEGSRSHVNPPEGGERTGGITNRPLDEEIDEQQDVPDRGDTKHD